jgi:hypothetical protein
MKFNILQIIEAAGDTMAHAMACFASCALICLRIVHKEPPILISISHYGNGAGL